MANPFRTTKSYYPSAGFNDSVGKKRNATVGYTTPSDQEAPQDPVDQRGPGYSNIVRKDWRRGGGAGGAESKPAFDHFRKGK
jgi:hypothetical protein